MLGPLCPAGHTPDPDGWVPEPLVEDRLNFGLHVITSSPLILSFNVSNDALVAALWGIIANTEAIQINQQWAGSPGRLVATLGPRARVNAAAETQRGEQWGGTYVARQGQLGQVSGWGHNPHSARGLTCPTDAAQRPGAPPTCNLLRVATCTVAEAHAWCTAHPDCAAFSYRGGNSSAPGASGAGAGPAVGSGSTVVYFKDATSLFFMDSNSRAGGQVQPSGGGWLSQIKAELAPPGVWRAAPCAGTTCPANSRPCHTACLSIAPCCSDHGPAGEALDFGDGVAQLWSKRLVDGSVALLFANLGKAPITHSFPLDGLGLGLNATASGVSVRDVWQHKPDGAPIARGGSLTFAAVAGHDSRLVVLSPVRANVPRPLNVPSMRTV
jgi:hypothetical protein